MFMRISQPKFQIGFLTLLISYVHGDPCSTRTVPAGYDELVFSRDFACFFTLPSLCKRTLMSCGASLGSWLAPVKATRREAFRVAYAVPFQGYGQNFTI